MTSLSNTNIEALLKPYKATASPVLTGKIRTYISLLLKWNRTISLTTVTDPAEIVKFHFGESLFAASEVNFNLSRLADVGSGAGFPGLPLAMAIPGMHVTLIESNAKKCAFLAEVSRELHLANVTIFRGRMEGFSPDSPPFNFIAARALGHHRDLLAWAKRHLAADGQVVLWLGEDDASALAASSDWSWQIPKLIPGSKRRFLLLGSLK